MNFAVFVLSVASGNQLDFIHHCLKLYRAGYGGDPRMSGETDADFRIRLCYYIEVLS